jgi:hypothetical protein
MPCKLYIHFPVVPNWNIGPLSGFLWSHIQRRTVGLLWTSDQPVAAADLRLRPRGHWDRLNCTFPVTGTGAQPNPVTTISIRHTTRIIFKARLAEEQKAGGRLVKTATAGSTVQHRLLVQTVWQVRISSYHCPLAPITSQTYITWG